MRLHADEENPKPAIQPRLAETTLSVAGRKIKPQRVQDSWRYEHSVVDLRISIDGDKVIATQAQTGKPAWTAALAKDGQQLRWLAADRDNAFLTVVESNEPDKPADATIEVRRLRLKDGEWLTPLRLPDDKLSAKKQAGQGHRRDAAAR